MSSGSSGRAVAALLGVVVAASTLPAQAPGEGPGKREVVRAVEALFEAMEERDTAAVRSLFHPEGRLVRTAVAEGGVEVDVLPLDDFVRAVAAAEVAWRERMWHPEVRIDGPLAGVWTPYTFHRGEEFSHCGIDAVHLVGASEGWRITEIAYTMRREGCARSSPGRERPPL